MTHAPSGKNYIHTRVLRLNVGYIVAEGPGYSRTTMLDIPQRVKVADDLVVERLKGDVKLTRTSEGILTQGWLECTQVSACDRCLREVETTFPFELEELFALGNVGESSFIVGDDGILNLAPLIREEIFLGVPSQILCEPDCKGLCIHCGHVLSTGPCECELEEIDPRWSALVDLQKRMAGQELK